MIVTADANPYRYVRSSPMNFTDPSGRGPCGQPVWDADLGRYVDPLYEQWAAEARARYRNAARGSPGETESPWRAGTKAGLYAFFVSGPRNLGVGAFNAGREAVYYVRDVAAVGADAVVTGTGALAGKNWSLGVEEWSQVGRNNQPSNPNFWSDALTNAGRAGLAAGTLGAGEIAIGTYQYVKTGDADAFQQQMGGVAAGNLAGAATIKAGQALRTTARSNAPSAVSPKVQIAASKVEEFLGKDMVVKRADAKAFVGVSKDGMRRFRMDLQGHGDAPHAHIEVFDPVRQRWIDAGGQHRFYFGGQE